MAIAEVVMSNMLSRLAGCVFALLVMAATFDVAVARADSADGPRILVQTVCRLGNLTLCGEEPARTECSREVKIDLGFLTEVFGIGLGELKCVQVGKVSLYKDYYTTSTTRGSCTLPVSPIGGGAMGVHDDAAEPLSAGDSSC
jgi:hypothetical protein